MKKVSILIPTFNRPTALAVTLTSLCAQEFSDFDIIISDQSDTKSSFSDRSVQTALRVLSLHGHEVLLYTNLPNRGIAQQRDFLLKKSFSKFSLYLDDDVILEPYVIRLMVKAIEEEKCGFVGRAVVGLSYMHDIRSHEQHIEFWKHRVRPEKIQPGDKKWNRYKLHNAANIQHVSLAYGCSPNMQKKYKVAWVGGCVLYDTEKLKKVGGFSFWEQIPAQHCGEDVLAQLRVMEKFGGCGLLPSGVYHQELPTTIPDRNLNLPEVFCR